MPIKAAALPLWMKLQLAVLEASDVPCCGPHGALWTSEVAEEREAATYRCTGCPVITACSNYASMAREKFGVWAGVDRTKPPQRALPIIPTETEKEIAL